MRGNDGNLGTARTYQARAAGENEGFEQFWLFDLLKEAESRTANVFIWMLLDIDTSASGTRQEDGRHTRSFRTALLSLIY
jgi:hypothetical protein